MRTLIAILSGLLAVVSLAPSTIVAQDIDVSGISDLVAPLTAKDIRTSLHVPLPEDQLPAGFSDAALLDETTATAQTEESGAQYTVTFSLHYAPADAQTPEAKPHARTGGPGRLYNTASLSYLIFDQPISGEALTGFDDMFRAIIGDQASDADVQEITLAGNPAYLVSVETITNGIPIVMDWVAIPVDKVVVIGMTMSGGESVDREMLRNDADALAIAAVEHLGTSIEQRGTPAG